MSFELSDFNKRIELNTDLSNISKKICDDYNLGEFISNELIEIGYEDYVYGQGVCLIEWANLIEEILPEKYTEIKIEKDLEKGFDYRKITVTSIGES